MDAHGSSRRKLLYGIGIAAVGAAGAAWGLGLAGGAPAVAGEVTVYKSPSCGCCGGWVAHMRANGFRVTVNNLDDLDPVKELAGVPDALVSCHTAFVGGYAIEGHAPAASVLRLLAERPAARGLAVPGMPASAPGMDGPEAEPYTVLAFDAEGRTRFWDAY